MGPTRSRRDVPSDVDAELAFHLEMLERRYRADGLTPGAARAKALDRLGEITDVRRECRALARGMETGMHRRVWLQGVRQDLSYAWRVLRKAPAFSATALVTIAIGVGASTAIFSVVNDVLLRRLPYPAAERLVVIWNSYAPTGLTYAAVAAPEFADIADTTTKKDEPGAFERVAAIQPQSASLTGACADCEPENVHAYVVSPNLFDVLRVLPRVGRPFTDADGAAAAEPVVLLSDALWQRRFGADPSVVGRSLEINGRPRTVIGIMPADVRFPDAPLDFLRERADLWVPYAWERNRAGSRGDQNLAVLARVRDDAPLTRAQTDLDTIADRFRAQFPGRYAGADRHWRMVALSLRAQMVGDVRPALLVLLGAVGCVLLIACANVANLMLGRGAARSRELAVRSALGAGRGRLVRQLLIEAAVLTAAGGAAGVLLAVGGVQLLLRLDPTSVPRLAGPRVDAGVLAFSIGVTIVTGLLLGLAPALKQSRVDPQAALGDSVRGTDAAPLPRRLRGVLVIGEVALAMIVLVGAGLLVRSFSELARVAPGFDASNTVTFEVTLPRATYDTGAKRVRFYQSVAERLAALPGAAQASGVYPLPMSGEGWSGSFFVDGLPTPAGQPEPHAEYGVALPTYFRTLRIPILAGREFSAEDTATSPAVVVVDDVLAKRYWPGQPALGQRLSTNGQTGPFATVVGVVGHVHNAGPQADGEPQLYLPIAQNAQPLLYFTIRTSGAPDAVLSAVRTATHLSDPKLPIAKLSVMTDVVARAVARERFNTWLFTMFGIVALVLAAVGLYGVMAFLVTQRMREIGIRIALGGRPARVLLGVIGDGLTLTIAGIALGVGGALLLSRTVTGLLFGISPTDPFTYGAIAALLIASALAASYVPARRASRVDPANVLKA